MALIESFQIDDTKIVSFLFHSFSGMVGESIEYTTASLVDFKSNTVEEISYERLREIYRTNCRDLDKTNRIKFWSSMKTMSPEYIAERAEEERLDAISMVI